MNTGKNTGFVSLPEWLQNDLRRGAGPMRDCLITFGRFVRGTRGSCEYSDLKELYEDGCDCWYAMYGMTGYAGPREILGPQLGILTSDNASLLESQYPAGCVGQGIWSGAHVGVESFDATSGGE